MTVSKGPKNGLKKPSRFRYYSPIIVKSIVLFIGLYDILIGLFMMLSKNPELAHGAGTVWSDSPIIELKVARPFIESTMFRIGSFSFHAGILTWVWCLSSWNDRRSTSILLIAYLFSGLGFFFGDMMHFAGTRYFFIKQVLGGAWALAVFLHFMDR
jgi:hypothetical protein